MKIQTPWPRLLLRRFLVTASLPLLIGAALSAAPSPIGTGLKSNLTLGAL